MSFVLLLLLAVSALVRVELSATQTERLQQRAQLNAQLALSEAVGQLQKVAGPDQRITAPATTAFPEEADLMSIFRSHARNNAGYQTHMTETGRDAWDREIDNYWTERNPHWVGVWDSGLRNADGDPDREQAPVWLVSGNKEIAPTDSNYFTPETSVPNPETDPNYVWLVDEGSATNAADSVDGLEGRVAAPLVSIADQGHFAWWVGDESTKANVALLDPFFDATDITSPEYRNRLQSPLRHAWEMAESFRDFYQSSGKTPPTNDPIMEQITSTSDLSLVDKDLATPSREHFHNLTALSHTVLSDPARGGLKKDLTVFFEDGAAATGGGISLTRPIPDPDGSDPLGYGADPRFADNNNGYPLSDTNIPTWESLKNWYDNEASGGSGGSVSPGGEFMPVLTYFRLFVGFSYSGDTINLHFAPVVVLWNPFDAGLNAASYELRMDFNMRFSDFHAVTIDGTDPDPANPSDGLDYKTHYMHAFNEVDATDGGIDPGNSSLANFEHDGVTYNDVRASFNVLQNGGDGIILRIPSASFDAGETLIFSIGSANDRLVTRGADGYVVELENVFFQDQPTTAYLPVLKFKTGTVPAGSDDVRFIANIQIETEYDFQFSGPGSDTITISDYGKNFFSGTLRSYLIGPNGESYSDMLETPENWRNFHALGSEFALNIRGAQDTVEKDASLFPIGEAYLQPMNPRTEGRYRKRLQTGAPDSHNYMNGLYRAFATHNLNAQRLGLHPLIDEGRGPAPGNNDDGFARFSYAHGTSIGETGSPAVGLSWGEAFSDEASGVARGSSLITFTYPSSGFPEEFAASPFLSLRQVKRPQFELVSIGQLQQVNLSPFLWQPAFPIGNAEASPYVDRENPVGISRRIYTGSWRNSGVANDSDNTLIDLSYLLNDALWDRYFLSTVPQSGSLDRADPLPNARHRFIEREGLDTSDLRDFDTAAAHLFNTGALNVNTTSEDAWIALLSAFRDLSIEGEGIRNPPETIPVSRTFEPLRGPVDFTFDATETDPSTFGAVSDNRDYESILGGFRYLTDPMIESLARRIVDEVRMRGPFFSVADFVNRRLVAPDQSGSEWLDARTDVAAPGAGRAGPIDSSYDPVAGMQGINGTLQRAINLSGINGGRNYPTDLSSIQDLDRTFAVWDRPAHDGVWSAAPGEVFNATYAATGHYLDTEHIAGAPAGEVGQLMSHTPGFVTQGDLLAMIGSALTARGDTFRIRTYGDVTNPSDPDKPLARGWLEAVVQRLPDPVIDENGDFEPDDGPNGMGRLFRVLSFRWLSEDEV